MSRMGDNNSPILLTETPQVIATFNKPIDLAELVGNLNYVMFYDGEPANGNCISIEEDGQTLYVLANEDHTVMGYLTADGNYLLCHSNDARTYLFDIDFKHQNKKFWPDPMNEIVGITCPALLSDSSKYAICKIVSNDSGKIVRLQVNNGTPISVDDSGTIAAASWFTTGVDAYIGNLVRLILQLEYDDANAGSINVTTANDSIGGTDGLWNLFTDGDEFVPLRIVSRFPSGSPSLTISGTANVLATFNRQPNITELVRGLEGVFTSSGNIYHHKSWVKINNNELKPSGSSDIHIYLGLDSDGQWRIKGSWVGYNFYTFDIDYNSQFRRALPSTDLKYNVQVPQLLASPSRNEGIGLKHITNSRGEFGVFVQSGTNDPRVIEGEIMPIGSVGQWANSLSWANVQSVLQEIIAMEYNGFDDTLPTITPRDYSVEESTGFTVTPLIPQTLS